MLSRHTFQRLVTVRSSLAITRARNLSAFSRLLSPSRFLTVPRALSLSKNIPFPLPSFVLSLLSPLPSLFLSFSFSLSVSFAAG